MFEYTDFFYLDKRGAKPCLSDSCSGELGLVSGCWVISNWYTSVSLVFNFWNVSQFCATLIFISITGIKLLFNITTVTYLAKNNDWKVFQNIGVISKAVVASTKWVSWHRAQRTLTKQCWINWKLLGLTGNYMTPCDAYTKRLIVQLCWTRMVTVTQQLT